LYLKRIEGSRQVDKGEKERRREEKRSEGEKGGKVGAHTSGEN